VRPADPGVLTLLLGEDSNAGAGAEGEKEGNGINGINASPPVELVVGSCVAVGLVVEGLAKFSVGDDEGMSDSSPNISLVAVGIRVE
jgi:hypothetical protein